MKTCWIIVNGALVSAKFAELHQFIRLAALEKQVDAKIIKNDSLIPMIEDGSVSLLGDPPLPDFVLFMDKDIHLAATLEKLGLPVWNSAESIERCDNKIKTHLALTDSVIPTPKTIVAPFIFAGMRQQNEGFVREAATQLTYPLILKEAYGSFGDQVYFIDSEEALFEKVATLSSTPFLLQQYIQESHGKDIRINIVGERCVAAMYRHSQTDFRANASQGGTLLPYQPSSEEIDLAIRAARATNTTFAGVDLLFSDNGPLVCEVNANAHLLNIYYTTGINVASFMVDHCLQQLSDSDFTNKKI